MYYFEMNTLKMNIAFKKLLNKLLLFIAVTGTIASCNVQKKISKEPDRALAVRAPNIPLQERKLFSFNNGNIVFSNRFLAGRLNSMQQLNDSTFTIYIEPENRPVNPSPWYAFKVWSKNARNIYLNLNYARNKHRYDPKISRDHHSWENLEGLTLNPDSTISTFILPVNSDTVTVAAQEVISSVNSNKWADSLATLPFLKEQIIGYSLLGKPIVALNSTTSSGKNLVVIISRQHPPEVTGYLAMQEFVHTLTASNELARNFREKFEIVLVPMVNPDGVDEGNWRHSAAGVDLNRDWEFFKQPETRAVKDFLLKKISEQHAKVYFAFDFHSTWNDILYTNSDTLTNSPGLTRKWIAGFEHKLGVTLKSSPSGNGGNVSKAWFSRELKTDALTYEVGDDTSREMIRKKGELAAQVMMELLIELVL